jgi:hypothetical protein
MRKGNVKTPNRPKITTYQHAMKAQANGTRTVHRISDPSGAGSPREAPILVPAAEIRRALPMNDSGAA